MDKKLNYLTILLSVILFTVNGEFIRQIEVIGAFLTATIIAVIAFWWGKLSLHGLYSALLAGGIVYGFGSFELAACLIFFFISSHLVGRSNHNRWSSPRDGKQVWANSLWVALLCLLDFSVRDINVGVIAAAVIAGATADTWATEFSGRFHNARTYLITTFKKVEQGTDGAISIPGTLATLAGSASIAILWLALKNQIGLNDYFFLILVSGLAGSLADSFAGALFQTSVENGVLKHTQSTRFSLNNDHVNIIGTGFAAITAIIWYQII